MIKVALLIFALSSACLSEEPFWYPPDKYQPAAHFLISAGFVAGMYYLLPKSIKKNDRLILSMITGIIPGIIKERMDEKKNKFFNMRDIVWDGAGVAFSTVLILKIEF